jgi:homoserine dehydrogenase
MTTTYRLALLGFGVVGQGLAEILRDKGAQLEREHGARFVITAIADPLKGSLSAPEGLDPQELLDRVGREGNLRGHAAACDWDALHTIDHAAADVVVEMTYTDLKTGEPATTHFRRALQRGCHIVTTNKGPIALHYRELAELAAQRNLIIGYEGTVMSGTPSLRMATTALRGCAISAISGILNGTTNYILTQMEAGATYEAALQEAQRLGYAEADPTGDVEGHDAAAKVAILANVLMGASIGPADVEREGITRLTPQDIESARSENSRWKLIGSVSREGERVSASVRPQRMPLTHPLASVSGPINAVTYTTDMLGDVTLVGPGAGKLATGFAVLSDLLDIHARRRVIRL